MGAPRGVAVVVGAAGGIGAATARRFAAEGFLVCVADVDEDGLGRLCAEPLGPHGETAVPVTVDVTDEASVASLAETVRGRFGRLDALHVNAATMDVYGDVVALEPARWKRAFEVNTHGAYHVARALLPLLVEDGGGAICFTASDTTVRTPAAYAGYLSSKHAVVGLARSVAVDFGGRGVRANVVSPGVTDTPQLRALYGRDGRDADEVLAKAAALSPLGRVAQPEEIAEAVVFLCSPRASFITGAHLIVDGGMTVTYDAE